MAWQAWTEEELRLLGKIPDGEFIQRFGRTRQAILMKRYVLGISSHTSSPSPAPEAVVNRMTEYAGCKGAPTDPQTPTGPPPIVPKARLRHDDGEGLGAG